MSMMFSIIQPVIHACTQPVNELDRKYLSLSFPPFTLNLSCCLLHFLNLVISLYLLFPTFCLPSFYTPFLSCFHHMTLTKCICPHTKYTLSLTPCFPFLSVSVVSSGCLRTGLMSQHKLFSLKHLKKNTQ